MRHIEELENVYSMYNENLDLELSFEEYYKIIRCETFLIWQTMTDQQKKLYKNIPERLFEVLLLTDTQFKLKQKKFLN
ncbi:hypothetical protein [Cetobacterium sp.]|uniref:hypothetical protein n=1 Tax=Cetobacterium sp. TaxID=2071632 RepID=UPI003F2AE15D